MNYKFNNFSVNLFENGIIKDIHKGDVKVNLLTLSQFDNPLFNVHIRKENQVISLLDTNIKKEVSVCENGVSYIGEVAGVNFVVSFIFSEETYNVNVELSEECEVIYTQDIGINGGGNTLYASQYIDNRVYETETGYAVLMRRTQRTGCGFPFTQIGSFNTVIKYATEGFDFYSKDYRTTKTISNIDLPSRERNYELSFCALEVASTKTAIFYGYIMDNKETPIKEAESADKYATVLELGNEIANLVANPFKIDVINGMDVEHVNMIDAEYDENNNLLAYFKEDHTHVILPTKEVIVDRHHANIMTSCTGLEFNTDVLVTSNYMTGIFWAQNAVGNTQINSINKNIQSYLDFNILEGLRAYVKVDGEFKLLNMPSFYEVGFNYSKWVYKLVDNTIEITVHTSVDNTNVVFNLTSTNAVDVKLIDVLNDNFNIEGTTIKSNENSLQAEKYPNLVYEITTTGTLENNTTLVDMAINKSYGVNFEGVTTAQLVLCAGLNGEINKEVGTFATDKENYFNHFTKLLNGYKLQIEGKEAKTINAYNHLMYWYLHNGLIHFATPHGVEQHGGAAWGTRDVCQGPVELFLSLGHFDIVRQILIKLFDNQFVEDGNWPQWFMFDEYSNIRPNESHGDIIAWPIKALSTYLNITGDLSILDEEVGFYHHDSMQRAEEKSSVYAHVKKEIEYITTHFIGDTHISKYGEGDWDDTLQPANSSLRNNMASGWTVPLTYQGVKLFSELITDYDSEYATYLQELSVNIKNDYREYFIKDGVVAGFIYFDTDKIDYMLHPNDEKTGINYRLLPINESIISGIFTNEEVESHINIIDENLKCPDGVRLMNNPVKYDGGVEHIFQRGESASTIGREISLQYVHAHIRYIESMTTIKKGSRAYEGLNVVNPFIIRDQVKNAAYRQSNSYFSSSEGDFDNRYVYEEGFKKLFTGDVAVRGGWRIYSSGPGIYLNQLISNYFGIKLLKEGILINTAIGAELDGLNINLNYNNQNISINFGNENSANLTETKIRGNNGLFISKEDITADMNLNVKLRG